MGKKQNKIAVASKSSHQGMLKNPSISMLSKKQQKRDAKRASAKSSGDVQIVDAGSRRGGANITATSTISVYKRPTVYPTPYYSTFNDDCKIGKFITPNDSIYSDVMSKCYQRFAVEGGEEFEDDFHRRFKRALKGIEANTNFLKFDITQPAGLNTKIAKTYVSRCVVGEPGMTYKYLGLRLFAYPWAAGELGATQETTEIGRLNQMLIDRTSALLKQKVSHDAGSCQYNLTLINRCFPAGEIALKKEPMFEKDNCTVSWHADSSLEHFSTIGVYHVCLSKSDKHASNSPWSIALRVRHDSEGPESKKFKPSTSRSKDGVDSSLGIEDDNSHPEMFQTPPAAIPLPKKCCYYMFDDFNHHHQHSVLVGSTNRFASTHRVSKREGHSFSSIISRCKNVLQGSGCEVKQIRAEQSLLNEIEFEWIRQFYVQGQLHFESNVWWREPIQILTKHWYSLEERTLNSLQVLQLASVISDDSSNDSIQDLILFNGVAAKDFAKKKISKLKMKAEKVSEASYDVMANYMSERFKNRMGWVRRYHEKLYSTLPLQERPVDPPLYFSGADTEKRTCLKVAADDEVALARSPLPFCEQSYLDTINMWKEAFLNMRGGVN